MRAGRMPLVGSLARAVESIVIVGLIAGLVSVLYIRLIVSAHALRPAGWLRLGAPIAVFTALGVVAIAYPQVLGNGKGVVQLAMVGGLAVGVMAVLIVLKPLATAACLGGGAPGGMFTPTLTRLGRPSPGRLWRLRSGCHSRRSRGVWWRYLSRVTAREP